MKPNDDLARWGEPPASEAELALAHLLAELLDRDEAETALADQVSSDLLEAGTWLDLIESSGVLENLPCAAVTGGPASAPCAAVDLRLCV